MKHLQPHMTLYLDGICFNCGGNSELNVESLIMILFSAYIDSLIPPFYVSLARLLLISLTETYMKHLQPHMTLYLDGICFNCGGNSERNVESLIMILFSAYIDSLSSPFYVSLTRLL